MTSLNVSQAVRERYSSAAHEQQPALCCPVSYDARWLEVIPQEILERDYGCGDPSRYVQPGETVVDLGAGGGKICYIAAQIVGAEGQVIGVDVNDEMLALARKHQPGIAARLGFDNVTFRKGRIQDLKLDLEQLDVVLAEHPVRSTSDWLAAEERAESLRAEQPMIPDASVDVVLSNCVLNLVRQSDRRQLFSELARVLKPGGRAVVSDIVSDREVPPHLQQDATLWSGCISGAFEEEEFLAAFEAAGFYGLEVMDRQAEPWAVVEGIEFRSVTIRGYVGAEHGPGETRRRVIYRGPWKAVMDDEGREYVRGETTDVSDATYERLTAPPFRSQVIDAGAGAGSQMHAELPLCDAQPGQCC